MTIDHISSVLTTVNFRSLKMSVANAYMLQSLKLLRGIYRAFGLICVDEQGNVRPLLVLHCTALSALKIVLAALHIYSIYWIFSADAFSRTELFTICIENTAFATQVLVSIVNLLVNTKFLRYQMASVKSSPIASVIEVTYVQILCMQLLTIAHFSIQTIASGYATLSMGIATLLDLIRIILMTLLQFAIYLTEQYCIINIFLISRILRNANKKFATAHMNLKTIKQLRTIYYRLNGLSSAITDLFQLQLVTMLSSACIFIVTAIFKIVRLLASPRMSSRTWLVVYLLQMLHEVLKLWSIGWFCQDLAEEVSNYRYVV